MNRLQFITHRTPNYSYTDGARLALEGGCRWIQLRMKDKLKEEIIETGRTLRKMCDNYGATFILDDHVEIVNAVGADGVHLGQMDMPIREARDILGDKKIIGGTANTLEEIRSLYHSGADYIGCGPFRYTTTKANLAPIIGLNGYENLMIYMSEEELDIPVIAIGGIQRQDVVPILQTGVSGIAISSALLQAKDPVETMKLFIKDIVTYEARIKN